MIFKTCLGCKEIKDLFLFAKDKNQTDGKQKYCKICQKIFREKLKLKEKLEYTKLTCAKCNIEKNINNFTKNINSITGYFSWCKDCKHKYDKNYQDYQCEIRIKRVEWIRSIKSNKPCIDCGKILDPELMDYDHIKGVKVDNISRMVLHNVPKERISLEIEKCELVCLFCHNIRTKKRFTEKSEIKNNKIIQRNINIINNLKDKPCEFCGKKYDSCNMQFDHINPNIKHKQISHLKSAKVNDLLEEISKCRILCAACHRKKSLEEQKKKKKKKK